MNSGRGTGFQPDTFAAIGRPETASRVTQLLASSQTIEAVGNKLDTTSWVTLAVGF